MTATGAARVLVADDQPENLSAVGRVLLAAGYEVRCVGNGAEALRLAMAERPDLVLLDIHMPDLDGFEVCRRLKRQDATRDIPVIFLSASGDLSDKLQAFRNGGVDYVEKPFYEEEVLARVEAHLGLRRAQLELRSARDTMEQKVLERTLDLASREAQYKRLVETSPSIIYSYSTQRGYLYVSPQVQRLLGYAPDTLRRDAGLWNASIHPDDRPEVDRVMSSLAVGRGYELEYRVRDIHGAWHWLHDRCLTVRAMGREVLVDGLASDITEQKRHAEAMEHLAYHDPLTGLINRKRLQERMDARMAEGATPFALLLLDLDRFKEINDALGHHVGDELLLLIAERLKVLAAPLDGLVARLGGDEFAVCLGGMEAAGAESWARRVLVDLAAPFALEGIRLEIGCSIGIAAYPRDGQSASELLRCADVAMYVAKRTLSGYSTYSPRADSHSPSRLTLVAEFAEGLRDGQLVLHYQPKQCLRRGHVAGMEALVRWQHPRHGLLMPGQFLPLIEVSDLVRKLTYWVIEAATRQLAAWNRDGLRAHVAINFSARNLVDDAIPGIIARALDLTGVQPEQLEVEITETAMMVDPDRAIHTLRRIEELGVGLAIDDFGTGYSSFALIRRMPPLAALKIDRSFVSRMRDNTADMAVVESMVHLVNGLGIKAVAEGVEDAETLEALRRMGCQQAQGYFIAKPMPADAMAAWLRERMGAQ